MWGGEPMSVYEALSVMIAFGMLVAFIMSNHK
ncbi:putative holin-like toxin [uncultured Dialister sp.]